LRYIFEDSVFDADRRELRRGTDAVSVAPQVFDLLEHLIRNRERVVSKDDLIAAIWGGRIVSDAAVTTRINAARAAVGDSGEEQRLIRTLPRKGFRFVGAVREEKGPSDTDTAPATVETPRPALALPDKPSIAVLPFANLNADPEQEYFADGIVADIITELSRFSELFVIARNSSFQYKGKAVEVRQVGRELGVRYVLEGSVRRVGGDHIRISAQLIDAAAGGHRWAERYDRKLEDIFAVQDELVRTLVAILAAHVTRAETERTRAKPPNSWQAYDYYLQGVQSQVSFSSSFRVEELYEARRLLRLSLSVDEGYARSYAVLANTHAAAWANRLDSDFLNPAALDQAHECARKAVQLDPNLPEGRAALAMVLAWKRQHEASLVEIERAIALNPNYVDWLVGLALVLAGQSRRAIDVLEASMRLDPFYPAVASFWLGFAHYMLKQYARALPALHDCALRAPNLRAGLGWLAATYAQLGQMEEARAAAAEVQRLWPEFTISRARLVLGFKSAEDAEHLYDGLRKAGLPE
jgi:adenylate cyclase